jgi:hypothetical protein
LLKIFLLTSLAEAYPTFFPLVEMTELRHYRFKRGTDTKDLTSEEIVDELTKENKPAPPPKEEIRRGDVKQSGAFGGQNFSLFSFKGSQVICY